MILWVVWDQWGRWQTFSSLKTDCPKIQQLKTFTLLWFLWVRNSGEAQKWTFGWRSFMKLQSKCQLRLWSYLKTRLGEYAPKLTHMGLSIELPHASPKVKQLRVRASKTEAPVLGLILEVTSHYLCLILFTRTKSLTWCKLIGTELYKGVDTKRWGSWCKVVPEAADHSWLDHGYMDRMASFTYLADEI